jgi:hypothetical protein
MKILIHRLLSKSLFEVQKKRDLNRYFSKTAAAMQQSGNLSKLNKIVESGKY